MKRSFARLVLWLTGWKQHGTAPKEPKVVMIAAPHTSNWDFIWVIAFAWSMGIDMHWLGKHTLFRWPFGILFRALGGVPVRRDRRENLVDQLVQRFAEADECTIVVPAKGTRSYAPRWKSGFYHTARAAKVPVALSFLDYGNGIGGIGPVLHLTGDVRLDMDRIRGFYDRSWGKYPADSGEIQLAEEQDEDSTVA